MRSHSKYFFVRALKSTTTSINIFSRTTVANKKRKILTLEKKHARECIQILNKVNIDMFFNKKEKNKQTTNFFSLVSLEKLLFHCLVQIKNIYNAKGFTIWTIIYVDVEQTADWAKYMR